MTGRDTYLPDAARRVIETAAREAAPGRLESDARRQREATKRRTVASFRRAEEHAALGAQV